MGPSPGHYPPDKRLPACGSSRRYLANVVISRAADDREAHSLCQRLHIELLPSIKASLPLASVVDEINLALRDRDTAVNELLSKPGATAATVVTGLLEERLKATASAGITDSRPNAPAEATRSAVELQLTGSLSVPFRELKAAVESADVLTEEGQREALAAGFDGRVTLAIRVLTSTREEGDVHVRYDPVFSTLSDLRPEIFNYFNYLYRVQKKGYPPHVTYEVPTRMETYRVGASNGDRPLLDALLSFKLGAGKWVPAPHGVMGRQMCLDNQTVPVVHDPRDYYCQPDLVTKVCEFVHLGLRGMGCADNSSQGYTMITLGEFFADHLKMSATLPTDEAAYRWVHRAAQKFEVALELVSDHLRSVVRSQSLDKTLDTYVLPFDSEATHELKKAEAIRERKLNEEREDPIFSPAPTAARTPGHPPPQSMPQEAR